MEDGPPAARHMEPCRAWSGIWDGMWDGLGHGRVWPCRHACRTDAGRRRARQGPGRTRSGVESRGTEAEPATVLLWTSQHHVTIMLCH